MEFFTLLLILVSVLLLFSKPELEKLAFCVTAVSWSFMIYLYIGHKSKHTNKYESKDIRCLKTEPNFL